MIHPKGAPVAVRSRRWIRRVVPLLITCLTLAGCATVVDGTPTLGNAPNANLTVKGSDNGAFDTTVKNALSDIMAFWQVNYPKIANGQRLTALKGGFYSVDGLKVAQTKTLEGPAKNNACAQKSIGFVVDNGAFCLLDDSISWDRAPTHLFAQLADKYGPLVVALIFAHEFGHAISYRKGVFDNQNLPTIDTESQADCAAGAWAASALKGDDPHFRNVTPATLDKALEGFLDGRDGTPESQQEISHGNGFDRLSAVADGIDKGPSYCFSSGYFSSRTFTERPFYANEGMQDNTPFAQVITTDPKNFFVTDLNRFWTLKAKTINKTFQPVKIASASRPKCGASSAAAKFGYCPDDNTVYFDPAFAQSVYNSLPGVNADPATGNVQLVDNQPGDFALGVMFSIGWGMAVRHQLFNRSLIDKQALAAAVCYSGAYAQDINVAPQTAGHPLTLSPGDLDEAVSAMLDQVGRDQAFGARGTSGLDRIQSFVKGYKGGLSAC